MGIISKSEQHYNYHKLSEINHIREWLHIRRDLLPTPASKLLASCSNIAYETEHIKTEQCPLVPIYHKLYAYSFYSRENLPRTWWCHQMETFSVLLALCEENPPITAGFPHKGQWRRRLIFFSICAGTNSWPSNWDSGDLRRHRAHYGGTVINMAKYITKFLQNW